MGLQVICERQNRSAEAKRYAELAHKFWSRAAAKDFEAELASLRQPYTAGPKTTRLDTYLWGKLAIFPLVIGCVGLLADGVADGPCVRLAAGTAARALCRDRLGGAQSRSAALLHL